MLFGNHGGTNNQQQLGRRLSLESLEDRVVLTTALGLDHEDGMPSDDTGTTETTSGEGTTSNSAADESADFVLHSFTLEINGERITVYQDDVVHLSAGDEIAVVGIQYATNEELEGVLAGEGYIHKLAESGHLPGTFDYADGRFGAGEAVAFGDGSHAGLSGKWVVEEGWDRLVVTAIRYFGNDSEVEGSIFARLQVGKPDFAIDDAFVKNIESAEFQVGRPIDFRGLWTNDGSGYFHDYMEIDVVNVTDGAEDYEWVGVLVGNAGSEGISGAVDNHNDEDSFAEVWTPTTPGEYLIIVAVDPEQTWEETDETNNFVRIRIKVAPAPAPPKGELVFEASFEDRNVKSGEYKSYKSTDGFRTTDSQDKVEVQDNIKGVGGASDGEQHIELDSDKNVSISREFKSESGQVFSLNVDYSPRPGVSAESNTIEVLFNGEVVATLSEDGTDLKSTSFNTKTIDGLVASGKTSTIEFRAAGTSDSYGGLLDNVKLYSHGVPDADEASNFLGSQAGTPLVIHSSESQGESPESNGELSDAAKDELLSHLEARLAEKYGLEILIDANDVDFDKLLALGNDYDLDDLTSVISDFDPDSLFDDDEGDDWWNDEEGENWWDNNGGWSGWWFR